MKRLENKGQSLPTNQRYSIHDFNDEFANDDDCLEYIFRQKCPKAARLCDKCEKFAKHHRVTGRTAYACDNCGNHFYPLAGTIFEKSTTPLRSWFYAMYLMGSTRCGISAKQLQRELVVTYKTAWRMFRQIRTLMSEDQRLEGSTSVEMDETYIGGVRRMSSKMKNKTQVVGCVERGGRVIAVTAANRKGNTLLEFAQEKILPRSTVYTDEHKGYDGLSHMGRGYEHRRIKHSEKIYVVGDIHTNTIEGFWALVKNGLRGVYHSVGKEYLQSYLDEYSFRYNHRKVPQPMFKNILRKAHMEVRREEKQEALEPMPF